MRFMPESMSLIILTSDGKIMTWSIEQIDAGQFKTNEGITVEIDINMQNLYAAMMDNKHMLICNFPLRAEDFMND